MAHGLEARSPFLDTAVVEFGAALPDRLRMRFGKGKLLLRRAMREILPASILTRGKMGFGAPLGAWFRSDLAGFVRERLLDPASPIYEYLQQPAVEAVIARHGTARADLSAQIWALLTLESWLRQEKGWGGRPHSAVDADMGASHRAAPVRARSRWPAGARRGLRGRAGPVPDRPGPAARRRTRCWCWPATRTTSAHESAARLVLSGQARLLILTGGEPGPGDSAESLRQVALGLGVPPEAIRMEQVSRSTHESMLAVRPILEQEGIRTLAVVTSPYHQRRAALGGAADASGHRDRQPPGGSVLLAARGLVEDALEPEDRARGVREARLLHLAGVGLAARAAAGCLNLSHSAWVSLTDFERNATLPQPNRRLVRV